MNRLKLVIISPSQSTFVQGRNILDNVLLMHELLRGYTRSSGHPRAVIKIDIIKAYNTLRWEFLFDALKMLGFPMGYRSDCKLCDNCFLFPQLQWIFG